MYAPYWLDNRTGMDLAFQDAPPSGRIFGVRSRFDYNEVVAPGELLLGACARFLFLRPTPTVSSSRNCCTLVVTAERALRSRHPLSHAHLAVTIFQTEVST